VKAVHDRDNGQTFKQKSTDTLALKIICDRHRDFSRYRIKSRPAARPA
jgi:hypothetical protein